METKTLGRHNLSLTQCCRVEVIAFETFTHFGGFAKKLSFIEKISMANKESVEFIIRLLLRIVIMES